LQVKLGTSGIGGTSRSLKEQQEKSENGHFTFSVRCETHLKKQRKASQQRSESSNKVKSYRSEHSIGFKNSILMMMML
jgi:hypothetical protein